MIVCIRENCIDKEAYYRFGKERQVLLNPPYNYQFVECDKEDCEYCDFEHENEEFTFSIKKYNDRKQKEEKNSRIIDLKANLQSTDYKAIKFAEGLISEKEYKEIKEQRQAWRDEINELEVQLKDNE